VFAEILTIQSLPTRRVPATAVYSLDSIVGDMNAEVDAAIMEGLGNVPGMHQLYPQSHDHTDRFYLQDWNIIELKPFLYRIAARVSTLIFLGPEASRNEEWLDLAVSYTMNVVTAAQRLRAVSPIFQPIVQWWHPELRVCRQQVARARKVINPIVQDRLWRKASGETTKKTADMLSWIDEKARAKGVKIDFAGLQLNLSVAALHTTTETLSIFMSDMVENEGEN